MEIYLLEDVKGKGKKYDKLNLANGYANFLIKENKAVMVNNESTKRIQDELEEIKLKETLKNNTYSSLTDYLKGKTIKLSPNLIQLTPKGSLQKDITKKKLAEIVRYHIEYNNDYYLPHLEDYLNDGIKLKENIRTVGKITVPFQLGKYKTEFYVLVGVDE